MPRTPTRSLSRATTKLASLTLLAAALLAVDASAAWATCLTSCEVTFRAPDCTEIVANELGATVPIDEGLHVTTLCTEKCCAPPMGEDSAGTCDTVGTSHPTAEDLSVERYDDDSPTPIEGTFEVVGMCEDLDLLRFSADLLGDTRHTVRVTDPTGLTIGYGFLSGPAPEGDDGGGGCSVLGVRSSAAAPGQLPWWAVAALLLTGALVWQRRRSPACPAADR